MCQPGLPCPHGDGHEVSSPGLLAFHSAKSCGFSFTAVLPGTSSSPWSMSSSARFDSFP